MKTAIVTGAVGFIGYHTCQRLKKEGFKVIGLDNFSRKGTNVNHQDLASDGITIINQDITKNMDHLKHHFREASVVFHLAAQVGVSSSVADPLFDFNQNTWGSFNLLELIRKIGNKPVFIYSSTNKVYGAMNYLQLEETNIDYRFKDRYIGTNEDTPLDFHSPYGCSKGAADQYIHDYYRIFEIPTVVFRQSCIYGTQQFGVEEQGWLSWFTIAALTKRKITLFGTGKQVRDVLYVDDLLDAYMASIDQLERSKGQIFNIGGGIDNRLSLLEFISFMNEKYGLKLDYSYDNMRPGDQKIYISDNTRVEKVLGWKPKTQFIKGYEELLDWTKKNIKRIVAEIDK